MDAENTQKKANDADEYYIYLDFNGKLPLDIFKKEVFIRIANLHKKNPLVQVNDSVFRGTFDYPMGTNLFFKTSENSTQVSDAFIKRGPVLLDCVLAESKVMNMKQVRIPPRKIRIPKELCKIEFNLNWDYNTLLTKFADGTLKIEDIVKKEFQNQVLVEELEIDSDNDENNMDIVHQEGPVQELVEEALTQQSMEKQLEEEYAKLKMLAMKPMKQDIMPESIENCETKYEKAYEYHNIKCQVLKPCDFFRQEPVKNINEKTLSNCADIDRCVIQGLLSKCPQYPRVLSHVERNNILTLDNFDNLSLAARYYVLNKQVDDLEKYLETLTETEIYQKDEYGRSPSETLEIYKKLKVDVGKRIEDIKISSEEDYGKKKSQKLLVHEDPIPSCSK